MGGIWLKSVTSRQKNSMKYFCIIKEKIAYMECVIQSSMCYSFYLFLSILLRNVDNTYVSDSNAYIWISNCIQIIELYSNVRIYIQMLKECVFSTCSWKIASSDDVGKKISQLHQDLVNNTRRFSWTKVSKRDDGE